MKKLDSAYIVYQSNHSYKKSTIKKRLWLKNVKCYKIFHEKLINDKVCRESDAYLVQFFEYNA
jgi:hypothetical protein